MKNFILFLVWFTAGNILHRHLGFSMPMTLLLNSVIPGICYMVYVRYVGERNPRPSFRVRH